MFRSLFVLMSVLVAMPAAAQTIYRWKDARGTVHYTDDPSTAPKGVKVETTEGEELNSVTASRDDAQTPAKRPASMPAVPPPPQGAVSPVPPPPGAEAYDEGADVEVESTEQYWRTAFRDLHEKIRSLEDQIALDEKKVGEPNALPPYGCAPYVTRQGTAVGPYPYNNCWYAARAEYARLRERLAENRIALTRAKEDLADLERRAANASVPLEWRR